MEEQTASGDDTTLVTRPTDSHGAPAAERDRIRIDPSAQMLRAGDEVARFDDDDPDTVLRAYLGLVRRLRDRPDTELVALRCVDLVDLADFLDIPLETVTEQLCDLMGSSRSQRRVVVGMCLAGAMVVAVALPSVVALRDSPSVDDRAGSDPADRAIIDPGARPPVQWIDPPRLPGSMDGVIVVDVHGNWDRDGVLDEQGRLRRDPTEVPEIDTAAGGPVIVEEFDVRPPPGDSTGDSTGDPPGVPGVPGAPSEREPTELTPFPDRIVDPGLDPGLQP